MGFCRRISKRLKSFSRVCLTFCAIAAGLVLVPGSAMAYPPERTPVLAVEARGKETWRWWTGDEVGSRQSILSLGRRGDIPVLGRWFGSFERFPGISVFEKEREEVTWRVQNPEGSIELVTFGGEGDLVVAGADFDASGVDDIAVVKLVNGAARWRVLLNPFGGEPSAISERTLVFGKNGDRVLFASPDGATDYLGTFGRSRNGRLVLRLRNLLTREIRTFSRFPAALVHSSRPRPVALHTHADGSRTADRLAFSVSDNGRTTILVTTLSGQRVAQFRARDLKSFAVGEVDSVPGEELILLTGAVARVINVDSKQLTRVRIGAVTELVDEYQVAAFSSSSGGGGVVTTCDPTSPFDGNEGFVWKPNSDTQFFAVVVLPPRLTGLVSSVVVKRLNGDLIKELRYKGVGNGGRTAWQDFSLTGAAYRSTYGSIQVEARLKSGGCLSYLIQDPSVRVD